MKLEMKNKNGYMHEDKIDFRQFILFIIVMVLLYVVYKKWNLKIK